MTIDEVIEFLGESDNVSILTHRSPDGDTLGCGFALCGYLRNCGKKANVLNADGFPARFSFLYEGYEKQEFEEKCVIAVDIATESLLGAELSDYSDKIDLCIDHHISNTGYAKKTFCDPDASAACLVLYEILKKAGAHIDSDIAKCLYTGIATDTGCFKFQNTTPKAHIAAAELMEYGIGTECLNRLLFDIKSKGRIKAEQFAVSKMEFFYGDTLALIAVTNEMINEYGIDRTELDGFASIPIQVEGVKIGITVKESDKEENTFKISVRTDGVDASAFCSLFGGGGHIRASGCSICGSLDEVKKKLIEAAKDFV